MILSIRAFLEVQVQWTCSARFVITEEKAQFRAGSMIGIARGSTNKVESNGFAIASMRRKTSVFKKLLICRTTISYLFTRPRTPGH